VCGCMDNLNKFRLVFGSNKMGLCLRNCSVLLFSCLKAVVPAAWSGCKTQNPTGD
jgi:hypothetical protein